jgi:hypothetical protein
MLHGQDLNMSGLLVVRSKICQQHQNFLIALGKQGRHRQDLLEKPPLRTTNQGVRQDRKIDALRDEITNRFKEHLRKEKAQEVSSTSESEMPPKKIQAKAMPRQQKSTAGTVSSEHPILDLPNLRREATGVNP